MKITIKLVAIALLSVLIGAGCSLGGSKGPNTSGPAGMFISQDKGEKWQPISFVPTVKGNVNFSGTSVFRIMGDPKDAKTLYWLSRGQGLLYSYDEGRSWQQSVEPLNQGFVYDIALHPTDNCTLYGTNGRHVYKSEDCSRSWTEVYTESRSSIIVRGLAFDPFGEHHIYMLMSNGDLLKSVDKGTSWATAHRLGQESVKIIFDTHKEGLAYIATRRAGLMRTLDGAKTWVSLKDNFQKRAGVTDYRGFLMYPSEPDHIYWISKFGILKSKNAGNDWDQIELITPPGSAQIYAFTVHPKNDKIMYYTATINDRSTLYRSEDGGKSWITKRLPSGQFPTVLYAHPEQLDWVYLGFTIPPKK